MLTLAANDNLIPGRTAIHKLIYFEMQKISEIDFDPHIPYYYGPFNPHVACGLEMLVHMGIIHESRIPDQHNAYQYKILEKGEPIVKTLQDDHEKAYEKMKNIVETCKKSCNLGINPLSVAAKIHYMLTTSKRKNGMTEEKAIDMANKFGWSIKLNEVKSGVNLLKQLELVKIK